LFRIECSGNKFYPEDGNNPFLRKLREPVSSVSIVSGYGLDDQTIEVLSPAEINGFSL
jgi:hypothetical protein